MVDIFNNILAILVFLENQVVYAQRLDFTPNAFGSAVL